MHVYKYNFSSLHKKMDMLLIKTVVNISFYMFIICNIKLTEHGAASNLTCQWPIGRSGTISNVCNFAIGLFIFRHLFVIMKNVSSNIWHLIHLEREIFSVIYRPPLYHGWYNVKFNISLNLGTVQTLSVMVYIYMNYRCYLGFRKSRTCPLHI